MTIHILNETNIRTNYNKYYFGINTHKYRVAYSGINTIKQLELETREIEFYHLDLIGKINKLDNRFELDHSYYLYLLLHNNIDNLLYLELSCNKLTHNYIKHLSRFIIDTNKLLHLDISTSIIDDTSLSLLLDAITNNNSLVKLDISSVSINVTTAPYLSNLLENQTSIKYYNLYNTFQSMEPFIISFQPISHISSSIDTLLLGNNKIDDRHLPILLDCLTTNKLKFVDLTLNNITYKSLSHIRQWLTPYPLTFDNLFNGIYQKYTNQLSHLDITNNYLDTKSYPSILDIIKHNIYLSIFSIDYNISTTKNILQKLNKNKKCVIETKNASNYNNSIIISLYNILPIDMIEQLLYSIHYLEILHLKSL